MRFTRFLIGVLGLFAASAATAQTPPAASPPADPQNILNLDLSTGGRVSILLRPDKAPLAVERIKTLVRRGFYDGLTFHRVIEGFMAQGGDPKGTGEGGSELPDLKAEFNDLPHVRGVMSMARAQAPDSANSQFFIMLSPNLKLDHNYTAVGRVISGMAYVDLIEKGEPPANPSRIVKASMAADSAPVATAAPAPAAPPPAPAAPAPAAPPVAVAPAPAAPPPAPAAPAPAAPPVAAAPAPAAPPPAAPAPAPVAPPPVAAAPAPVAPPPVAAAPAPAPTPPATAAPTPAAPAPTPPAPPAPAPLVNKTVPLPPSDVAKEAEGRAAIEDAIGEALKEEQKAAQPQ